MKIAHLVWGHRPKASSVIDNTLGINITHSMSHTGKTARDKMGKQSLNSPTSNPQRIKNLAKIVFQ